MPTTNEDITIFGTTTFRNQERMFGIKKDDRRRHMYILGQTGVGKSTLQENLILSDIRAGHGVGVVDPHGEMVEKLIDFIPPDRMDDVVYFNPADVDYPIAFNILENVDPLVKPLIASGLVGVFKKIWADSWGPRLEYILMNTILALIDYEGSTLLAVTRMLVDKTYRKKVVDALEDPQIRSFWVDEFANYQDKFRSEAIAPIQNKVGQFLSSSIIRNILGQSKSTIDMRTIMDSKKIFLMNLSRGRIGEENSALLGAMMITKLQLAAMSRVDTPEDRRSDFYLYVDEFQNFATESFAQILSEARKYRLCLTLAHQYIEQLDETVQAAVFGNCGTLVVFRIGASDAEFLEEQFGPDIVQLDLLNIANFQFYIRLMIDGVTSKPFSGKGLPPISSRIGGAGKVIELTRKKYGKSRAIIEEKIRRWAGMHQLMAEATQEKELPKFIKKVDTQSGDHQLREQKKKIEPGRQTERHEQGESSVGAGRINFLSPKTNFEKVQTQSGQTEGVRREENEHVERPGKKQRTGWEIPEDWVPVSQDVQPSLTSLKDAILKKTVVFKRGGSPKNES